MSETSTYKRKVVYTLKDGTVKTKYYDFVYHKKVPKISKVKIQNLKRDLRASILNVDSYTELLKIQKFLSEISDQEKNNLT